MTDDNKNPGDQTPRVSGFTNMIEVQFQKGTRMELDSTPDTACTFRSEEDAVSVVDLNAFIREQGCRKAERVFDDSLEETADVELLASMDEVDAPNLSGIYVLHFPEDRNVHEIAKQLRNYSGVKYAAAVPFTKFASVRLPQDELLFPPPDDSTDRDYQWYIERCKVDRAWGLGFTGKEIAIAILDSGFQTLHPDLLGRFNMKRAFNTATCNDQLSKIGDNLDHGTGVAGLIGAAADGKGMVGIAHDAELWPIEVGPQIIVAPEPHLNPLAWTKAISQVIKFIRADGRRHRVVIIIEAQTLENRNITQIGMIREAILFAIAHGAVVCVPAGNGHHEVNEADCDDPPKCHGEIFEPVGIIVGATDINDEPYINIDTDEGTNFGDAVAVSAPGDPKHDLTCTNNLASSFPYTPVFGATSGAAAKVTGAIALMLQANPKLRHRDVEQILRSTGKLINSPVPIGRLLDCEEAVLRAKNFASEAVERAAVAAD